MTTSWTRLLTHLSMLMLMISTMEQLQNSLLAGANEFIPNFHTNRHKPVTNLPKSICNLISRRNRLHTLAKKTDSTALWSRFRVVRNKVVSAVRNCKKSFQRALSRKIKDPKQFWSSYNSSKAAYSRIPSSLSDSVSIATTSTSQADMLNASFANNFTKPTIRVSSTGGCRGEASPPNPQSSPPK